MCFIVFLFMASVIHIFQGYVSDTQRTHDAMMTSFWRSKHVLIAPRVRRAMAKSQWTHDTIVTLLLRQNNPMNPGAWSTNLLPT